MPLRSPPPLHQYRQRPSSRLRRPLPPEAPITRVLSPPRSRRRRRTCPRAWWRTGTGTMAGAGWAGAASLRRCCTYNGRLSNATRGGGCMSLLHKPRGTVHSSLCGRCIRGRCSSSSITAYSSSCSGRWGLGKCCQIFIFSDGYRVGASFLWGTARVCDSLARLSRTCPAAHVYACGWSTSVNIPGPLPLLSMLFHV